MSASYCVAVALVDGEVFPGQFSTNKIKDEKILALAQKVRVNWDEALDVPGNPRPVPATVIVHTTGGEILRKRVNYQKGTYRNPLTQQELEEKFDCCVAGKLTEKEKRELIAAIHGLERIQDVNQIRLSGGI